MGYLFKVEVLILTINHKIKIMKKLFFVLVTAATITACDNAADSEARAKDSLDSIANAKKDVIDSSADTRKDIIDSTTEQKKEVLDSLESLNNKVDTTTR